MTGNVKKVLFCLIEKKITDARDGQVNCGWMTIRDIAAECLFQRVGIVTGCVIVLVKNGIVEFKKEITFDNKIRKFYRVKDKDSLNKEI